MNKKSGANYARLFIGCTKLCGYVLLLISSRGCILPLRGNRTVKAVPKPILLFTSMRPP